MNERQNLLVLFFVLGLVFGFAAGLMAFLISYREYVRHFKDKRKPLVMSLQTGLGAFLLIMGISLLGGYILFTYIIK